MFRLFLRTAIVVLCVCVYTVDGQTITTVAGNGGIGYSGDGGAATAATLGAGELEFDSNGILYIGDSYNNRIRKINLSSGIINLVAGNGTSGFSGDGGSALTAQFNGSAGIAIDKANNIFIADGINHRIRKVDVGTGNISTFAGNGTPAFAGDGGPATAASLYYPGHLTFDKYGNLYISDVLNRRVRKVDTLGTISTVAGNGTMGSAGDGGAATAAELNSPHGLVCDKFGNLYISDPVIAKIRKVSIATGKISTIAGDGTFSFSSDGVAATSTSVIPEGLAIDFYGNLFVACGIRHNRVRVIDTAGVIHTVCGTGVAGYNGDSISADTAKLHQPFDVAFDACGNLYIADGSNFRIRKVTYQPNPHISIAAGVAAVGSTVTAIATLNGAGYNPTIKWYNHGALLGTSTTPSFSYIKTQCIDTLTAVVYGCGDSATSAPIIVRCNVGVAESNISISNLSLSPNPAKDFVTIDGKDLTILYLYDCTGREVVTTLLVEGRNTVPLAGLASGTYIAAIAAKDGKREYVRLVKE